MVIMNSRDLTPDLDFNKLLNGLLSSALFINEFIILL